MSEPIFNEDDRHYMQMLQDIITRMANNSSNCKTWMVSIFTAIMALQLTVDALRPYLWIVLIPDVLFYYLDGYYLGLENDFRNLQSDFIEVRKSSDTNEPLYNFNFKNTPSFKEGTCLRKGLKSTATWPIYVAIALIVGIFLILPIKREEKHVQQLEEPLREILFQQKSISSSLEKFSNEYKPTEVQTKTFHNSSFFQADNIDSVQINVVKGKPVSQKPQ